MKSSALLAVLAFGFLTTSAARAANVKAECAAAWKAAQSDKAAGKLVEAAADLATCSRTVCPKANQAQCTKLAATVDAATPTIVVTAEDASKNAVTDATVSVDGNVVAQTLDGKPIPVDPGHHTLHLESKGATPVDKEIDAAAGQKGQAIAIDFDSNPPAAPPPPPAVVKEEPVPGSPGTMTDTAEDPSKTYYFVGLRYRGDVVPSFIINLFVDNAQTVYTNAIALEFDIRRHGFSMVPSLTYAEFGTPNMLIQQKNTSAGDAGNWSLINSGLAGVFGSVQLLWSIKLVKHWDLELGTELGLGAIFGNLVNNWVYTPGVNGPTGFNPAKAVPCQATDTFYGCNPAQHSNNTPPHTGGFDEPSWVNGGSKPNIFPMVNFPQIGVRYKPIKQLETRLATGFSLTGFFFSLSADYGLETLLK